jgi:hypothetical protein
MELSCAKTQPQEKRRRAITTIDFIPVVRTPNVVQKMGRIIKVDVCLLLIEACHAAPRQ